MVQEALTQPEEESLADDLPKRILIVEDDADQLAALTYRLQKLGYDATTASSGQQAVAAANSIAPDLVLLDLGLPDVGGFEVCEKLVDSATTCGIPIIIVSGTTTDDIVRRARNAGCAYYLSKPYDPNVLLTLIENALALEW